MNIGVPSRFACLQVEDEFQSTSKNGANVKKKAEKPNRKNGFENVKKTQTQPIKPCQSVTSKKKRNKQSHDKQWEEWKKKDSELVNDNFEQDLQDAILQSKLDYESVYTEIQKQQQEEAEKKSKETKKKKKPKTMSLDAFLGQPQTNNNPEETNGNNACEEDDNFFEKIVQDTKKQITKEKTEQLRKERNHNIEEVITISQYQEKLEKEKLKNLLLQEELEQLKLEMSSVKIRNQTLCSILSKGEMKDKADVLIELERLNTVKNELTDEVTRLHGLLEQERSKVASLSSDNKHKGDKKNKKH